MIADDLTAPSGAARARGRLARLLSRVRIPAPLPERILARIALYAAGAGLAISPEHRQGDALPLRPPGRRLALVPLTA